MCEKKIVFSCSGCSFGGQAANRMALYLNKEGIAEMSCLAGIASGGKSFFKKVKGKKIWMIDGCKMNCGEKILKNANLEFIHFNMDEFGVKKFKKAPVRFKQISKQMQERG